MKIKFALKKPISSLIRLRFSNEMGYILDDKIIYKKWIKEKINFNPLAFFINSKGY